MPVMNTLGKKIQYRIKRRKESVFLLSDFEDLSDRNQVQRALRKLVAKNVVVKVGYGLYARARISKILQGPVPDKNINAIAKEALKKLGVKMGTSMWDELYKKGLSTQVPTGRVINVKGRITRKIGFEGFYIKYAK